jgi:hypothetical protein
LSSLSHSQHSYRNYIVTYQYSKITINSRNPRGVHLRSPAGTKCCCVFCLTLSQAEKLQLWFQYRQNDGLINTIEMQKKETVIVYIVMDIMNHDTHHYPRFHEANPCRIVSRQSIDETT